MEYVIKESRLFNAIYQYIDGSYDVDKIDFFNPETYDEDKEKDTENPHIIEFYNKEYDGDYDENGMLFVYIVKEYYKDEPSSKSFINQTPILIVNDYGTLESMFGEYWKEPFKKWFKNKFKLPVKTIVAD
jgi:hypothetical protein